MKPRCGTCIWFDRQDGGPAGRCLVDPPRPHVAMMPSAVGQPKPVIQGIRPAVHESERCSRHPDWLTNGARSAPPTRQ